MVDYPNANQCMARKPMNVKELKQTVEQHLDEITFLRAQLEEEEQKLMQLLRKYGTDTLPY